VRNAKFAFVALALLALGGTATAAPVSVTLDAHNQRSSSGTLSTLKWKACAPVGALNPCLSTSNVSAGGQWTLANATPSTAVWTWDAATGVLAMTGLFQTTSFVSSNANGSSVISDKVTDMVINTTAQTTTAATYSCVEGTFLSSVGAVGCLNVSTGGNFVTETTALFNVGGNANCVQRTIGGDDTSTGNVRGLTSAPAAGACEAVDGAFDLWTVVQDNTATGGQLVISNGVPLANPSTNYLTFTAQATAANDGPFNAPQDVDVTLDVLANDSGFTDPVTVTVSTAPTKGTAVVTGSPGNKSVVRIVYTADAAATGTDSFVYQVVGTGGATGTATVTLNILAFGANDDTATTTRNSAAITINVGANDVGLTNPVTVTVATPPNAGGTATPGAPGPAASATVSYTPATTAPGTPTYTETFTYDITDANSLTSSATVTVTVNNTVPVAGAGAISISTAGFAPAGRPGTFNAAALAGNNLGNTPSTVTATNGAKGTTGVSGNIVTYTVTDATFFKGSDTFSYTITDADPGTPETATNTVTVTIADVSPTITGGTITTTEGTASAPKALTFTAGNGTVAQHTLVVSTQGTKGTCAISGTSVTYTPTGANTGSDSCVVTITDEDGAGQSANATFNITINAAGGGGNGGGSGGLLPGGGSFDAWSLALLGSLPLLRRLRTARRRAAGGAAASQL
jgi:hypothetical protein